MRRTVVLVAVMALLPVGCADDGSSTPGTATATATALSPEPSGMSIVIQTRMLVAAQAGAEPIATGEVLSSTLATSPFCPGGTVVDAHGSRDPAVWLIAETITCPDGTLTLLLTPDQPQGLSQSGSWTVKSGTGAYETMRGSGEMEVTYDPDPDLPADVTLTGIVTR